MSGLVARGFALVPEEEAEVIVVNTCAFIGDARAESVEAILSLAGLKETGRLRALVVAGCLAERYRASLASELPEADAVIGLADRERIPDICLDLLGRERTGGRYARAVSGPPYTAYLKIAEGCADRCTFCAIPSIRGDYRSRTAEDILADAAELAALGIRELVLIAQDTTAWGHDLPGGESLPGGETLAGLLGRLNGIEGIRWLRILYAHPGTVTDSLIDAIAGLERVVPYLDMPVQHIAPRVLRRMGRPTPPDAIRRVVARLREGVPGIALRTAVIVGFPGETEAEFEELLAFIREIRFERLGAFIWSPEEGTPAVRLRPRVPASVANERFEAVMAAQGEIAGDYHRALIGRTEEIIVEEAEAGTVIGRTYRDAPEIDGIVHASGNIPAGEAFVRVRFTGAAAYDLEGEVE